MSANPVASFLMAKEACAKEGDEHPWMCGRFKHDGNNSLIKYAGVVTCHAAEGLDNNLQEMVQQANIATGFQDTTNDYVTSVLTGSGASYMEAAQYAKGAKRILDKKDPSVDDCVNLANNQEFRTGVMTAMSNGALSEMRGVSSDAQLRNELLGTCIVSGGFHTLCNYALESLGDGGDGGGGGDGDKPTPKPSKYSCQQQYGGSQCIKDSKGKYESLDECKKNCKGPSPVTPSPSPGYSCSKIKGDDNYECKKDPNGKYDSMDACKNKCFK